jgi:hypothetical protein
MSINSLALSMLLAIGGAAPLAAQSSAAGASAAAPGSTTTATGFYPNDLGPAEIDVSDYPKEMRQSYHVFAFKCAACHTVARPINSQFLELTPEELATAKKDDPDLFKDSKLVMPEEKIWSRYVKRMMLKPGCPVGKDAKTIYEFLVYDSKVRKMGPNAAAWREHRRGLLKEFKEKYPDSYKTVFPDAK